MRIALTLALALACGCTVAALSATDRPATYSARDRAQLWRIFHNIDYANGKKTMQPKAKRQLPDVISQVIGAADARRSEAARKRLQ